jgi:dihydrofolate synthase/folylpolyglutamate synthase
LIGGHQAINTAVAVRAAELLQVDLDASHIQRGLAQTRWPGRMQIERIGQQTWAFDVAHNVAGVQALVECVSHLHLPEPLVLVLGILGDKDWRAMLPPLFEVANDSILTIPPTAPANRTWDPNRALQFAGNNNATVISEFIDALEVAHERAGNGTVLVTGSFHTVGDALIALNRAPFGADVTLPRVAFAG